MHDRHEKTFRPVVPVVLISEEHGDVDDQAASVVDHRVAVDDAAVVAAWQHDQLAFHIHRIRSDAPVPSAGKIA